MGRYLGCADSIRYRSGLVRFDVLICSVAYSRLSCSINVHLVPRDSKSVQRSRGGLVAELQKCCSECYSQPWVNHLGDAIPI